MTNEIEKQVVRYDLVESHITTGRFPWMDMIVRRWAHRLESTLFQTLAVMFEVEPFPVELCRFEDFCRQIPNQQPLYVFDAPQYGQGMVAVNNAFAHACLVHKPGERLLSQPEHFPAMDPQGQKRLHTLLLHVLKDFEKSWQGVASVEILLKKVTSHLFRAKIMVPFERCIVSRVAIKSAGFQSELLLCFPYMSLDKITQAQEKKSVLPPEANDHYYPEVKQHFERKLDEGTYEISAELGSLEFNPGESSIKVDQIVPLRSKVGKELTVNINGSPVLTGDAGTSDGHFAVFLKGHYVEKKETFRKRPRPFEAISWHKA